MAASDSKTISTIAAALAVVTPSVDIPKPRDAGHPGITRSLPTRKLHVGLPTPPNSISPTLPPHKLRSPSISTSNAPPNPQESDFDLQDTGDGTSAPGRPQALSSAALSGLEAAGAITPAMLARDHLPDILLANGPMAIRHVLGHLCHNVPGFSRIPPAKARRIVVSALECRGGGGVNGDVLFEKVGWGRWDARVRGQPPREGRSAASGLVHDGLAISPPASVVGSYAISSAGLQVPRGRVVRGGLSLSRGSWGGSTFSRDDETDYKGVAEHEADKMSLDGPDDTAREQLMFPPGDDETDEEDWASIGPEALRLGTYPRPNMTRRNSHALSSVSMRVTKPANPSEVKRTHQRNFSALSSASSSAIRRMSYAGGIVPPFPRVHTSPLTSVSTSTPMQGVQVHGCGSQQERDAVAALLQMGSM